MTDPAMKKLRSILRTHEERAAKRRVDATPVPDEEERRRRDCGERLRDVAGPVIRDFVGELRTAGHEASLEDQSDRSDVYPSVALIFTPRVRGATALASTLAFRYDPRRGVVVQRDVKSAASKGVVTGSHDRSGTMKPEAVSAEWVETKALSFIEAVLRAS